MKLYCFLIIILLAISIQSCSKASWYEGLKYIQIEKCYELPDNEIQDCLKLTDKSYEQYTRERNEALKFKK